MASFTSAVTTGGARKHAWRTQAAWANNGQYIRLDQKIPSRFAKILEETNFQSREILRSG